MRKILLFIMMIGTLSLHAQNEQTYTEAFDSIFRYVNKTQATTGILYERVVPFAGLEQFDSRTATVDTSNYRHFIQAYDELYRAAFLPAARLTRIVEELENQVHNNISSSGIVDIGILHYPLAELDQSVLDSTNGSII